MSISSPQELLESTSCQDPNLPGQTRLSNVESMSFPKDPPGDDQEDGIVERSQVIRDFTGVNEDSNEVGGGDRSSSLCKTNYTIILILSHFCIESTLI